MGADEESGAGVSEEFDNNRALSEVAEPTMLEIAGALCAAQGFLVVG